MKTKAFSAVCLTLAITAAFVIFGTTHVSAKAYTVDEINSLIDGTLSYKAGRVSDADIQSFIDNELTEKAGSSSEWYVMILRQYGISADSFKNYTAALNKYVDTDTASGIVTRQKYALTMAALSIKDSPYAAKIADTAPDGGIMSLVFALHLYNNGISGSANSAEQLIDDLLSLQKSDGGWAVFGEHSDVDVTAMVCQSLAPYAVDADTDGADVSREKVSRAVELALSYLSDKQTEDGGYVSYGTENPESAAQVIVMLTSLSIDPQTDERFIKNGCSALDGMLEFVNPDSSFSHTKDGGANENATMQALYALTSLRRYYSGQSGFYIFDSDGTSNSDGSNDSDITDSGAEDASPDNVNAADQAAEAEPDAPTEADADKADTERQSNDAASYENEDSPISEHAVSYKVYAICAAAAVFAVVVIALFISGKRNPKAYIFPSVIFIAFVCFIIFTSFESADSYYGSAAKKSGVTGHVTLTIRCDTVANESRPAVILESTSLPIDENAGDTVYTILTDAAREYGIILNVRGSDGMEYVAGIDGLSEFDYGELSGWIYHVNGEEPSVGCGSYTVSDGDVIEWLYTCEFGHDLPGFGK